MKEGVMISQSTEDFQGNKNQYDFMMVYTCYYTLVKTYRMYSTKSEPICKLWTLDNKMHQCSFNNCDNNIPHWWGMGKKRGGFSWVISVSFNFAMNLKLLLKKKEKQNTSTKG